MMHSLDVPHNTSLWAKFNSRHVYDIYELTFSMLSCWSQILEFWVKMAHVKKIIKSNHFMKIMFKLASLEPHKSHVKNIFFFQNFS